ncbi:MAG: hypothetical protein U5L07_04685 [Desulfobacterales bacterium]|nr:hypothetical protein [Desulfobacterales bacterium]
MGSIRELKKSKEKETVDLRERSGIDIVRVIDDPEVDFIDSMLTKEDAHVGYKHAYHQFKKYYDLMIEADEQYKWAGVAGFPKMVEFKDWEFYRIAKKVFYYNALSDRLIKIWSQRTGCPIFLADQNGTYIWSPHDKESGAYVDPEAVKTDLSGLVDTSGQKKPKP